VSFRRRISRTLVNIFLMLSGSHRCSIFFPSSSALQSFVNEAAKCLEDEIIENPVVGDIGLVFGTGFAPFRGGPFRYLDQVGVQQYVDLMNGFTDKYGPQFEPCQLLKDYAASGKKFHSN
jgi:3-hydroxyacyl-CoA dehydrogenase